jgi:hypothetical protein
LLCIRLNRWVGVLTMVMKSLVALTLGLFMLVTAADASAQGASGPSETDASATTTASQEGGLLPEPPALMKALKYGMTHVGAEGHDKDGFFPELGNMITGAGWISIGPGYRSHALDGRVFVDASTAISWRAYKVAQARLELPHLAGDHLILGAHTSWQDLTQVDYYGVGTKSLRSDATNFRLRATDVMAYAAAHAGWFELDGRIGWLPRPKVSPAVGWGIEHPDTRRLFDETSAPGISRQPTFVYGNISAKVDTRSAPGHPEHGHFYRLTIERFADRELGRFSFRRYEAEGGQFVPLADQRWILAFREWGVISDARNGQTVPFYMLPALGGENTLRGYPEYRFHDRDLFAVDVESRWALFTHVDGAIFLDAGNVAPRADAFQLNAVRLSAGFGVRLHTGRSTIARLETGRSREGWRFIFKMNDPFALSRQSLHTVIMPFVP